MLARAVQQAPDSLSGADKAAQKLSDALDSAVGQLSENDRRNLAEALDLPANKPGTGQKGNTGSGYLVAAKRGLLVAATAMLFHHRLQGHLPALRPDGIRRGMAAGFSLPYARRTRARQSTPFRKPGEAS